LLKRRLKVSTPTQVSRVTKKTVADRRVLVMITTPYSDPVWSVFVMQVMLAGVRSLLSAMAPVGQ
jgi:hypothetical protein